MAMRGEKKPLSRSTIGASMISYTKVSSSSYDEKFRETLIELGWSFITRNTK